MGHPSCSASHKGEDPRKAPVIFVVGNPRSGTTMLSKILDNSPEISTFRELHFFERLWIPGEEERRLSREKVRDLYAILLATLEHGLVRAEVTPGIRDAAELLAAESDAGATALDVFARFLQFAARKGGGRVPCEQTPRNALYVKEILAAFPAAKIVHLVRDPRDVLLSQKRKWLIRKVDAPAMPRKEVARLWANFHPYLTGHMWGTTVVSVLKFADDPRVITVHYEKLVREPEKVLPSVCGFLGIDYDPALTRVPLLRSYAVEASRGNVGLDSSRAFAWKCDRGISPEEVYLCERAAGRTMVRLGYDPSGIRPRPLRLAASLLWLCLKAPVLLFFAATRSKKLRESVRRRLP